VTRDLLPRSARLVGSSRVDLLWLSNSFHVAKVDSDKDLISERTVAFIKSIAVR
jgi:carboxylesterase